MSGLTKLDIGVHKSRVAVRDGRERTRPERVLIYDPSSLAGAAAKWVIRALESAIRRKGHCTLALAGGSSWRSTYELMSSRWLAERVAWSKVDIYFGYERCVTPNHPLSNYGMAATSLLSQLPIPPLSVHRIRAEAEDPAAVARDYARQLPTHLDVLLLGVGVDGHTASLFPQSPAVMAGVRRVVAVKRPWPDVGRITITSPVISGAANVFVLAAGAEKSAAVTNALEGTWLPEQVPIQLARGATWLIDSQAARSLGGRHARSG